MITLFLSFFFIAPAQADFLGTGLDQDLTITIQSHVGTRANTKGRFFIRALLQRQGEEASFNCTRSFRVLTQRQQLSLRCSKHVGTPDHEDDEAISFELKWSRSRHHSHFFIHDVRYVGEGTFFSRELYTLLGPDWKRRLKSPKIIPLILTDRRSLRVFSPLSPLLETSYVLLGRKVLVDQRGLVMRLPVSSIYADVAPDFKVTVYAVLDTSELDKNIHVERISGPAVVNLNAWQDNDLLLGLNIN